jgi:transposase
VSPCHDARHIAALLDLPEIKQLIADVDETRWTWRPGYPARTMVGAVLVKVKAGQHKPPTCDHSEWTFAGADAKRRATKWRCPTGECAPASVWIKASRLHPLIPHGTERHKALYRQRTAVERGFGRLKTEYALTPLRVRRLARVTLHASLTILAQLASALLLTRDT